MAKIDDGGPAFPTTLWDERAGVQHGTPHPGLSLRDWFAGQAIAGMLSNPNGLMVRNKRVQDEKSYAFAAFAIADAMLSARQNKESGE